jgi:hypothetical protein
MAVQRLGALGQLVGRSVKHEPPRRYDIDDVGDRHGERKILLDQQDRMSLLAQAAHDLLDALNQFRRKPLGGLVHQDQRRIGHQRPPDRQHLLLTAAQRTAGIVQAFGELGKLLQHLLQIPAFARGHRLAAAACERAGRQRQVFPHRQRLEDATSLRNDRNAGLRDRIGRPAGERAAFEHDVAAARWRQTRNRADQRGLAHAVTPEDHHNLAGMQFKAEPVQHIAVAVVGVDLAHGEQRIRRGQSTPPALERRSEPRSACRQRSHCRGGAR